VKENLYQFISSDVTTRTADQTIAKQLKIQVGTHVVVVEKLYDANNQSAILSVGYLPESLFEKLPEEGDWLNNSNFTVLGTFASQLVVRDRIEIGACSKEKLTSYSRYAAKLECSTALE
jgi:DNA-binding GntR family transcriptional regulator